MSDFGNFIARQIKEQRTTGGELASRMGIDRTHFSAFLNGRRRSCNVETLMRMVKGISEDRNVRAGLLEAYFRDQCVEDYKAWIRVIADADKNQSARVREEPVDSAGSDPVIHLHQLIDLLRLPTELVQDVGNILSMAATHHKFRVLIHDLGKFAAEELLTNGKIEATPKPEAEGRMRQCPPPTKPLKYQETPVKTVSSGNRRGSLTPGPHDRGKSGGVNVKYGPVGDE